MNTLPILTFYLLYGRKSQCHHWILQCACESMARAEFLRLCFVRDAQYSSWDEAQSAIVAFDAEQSGNYERFPSNVRALPGVAIRSIA